MLKFIALFGCQIMLFCAGISLDDFKKKKLAEKITKSVQKKPTGLK